MREARAERGAEACGRRHSGLGAPLRALPPSWSVNGSVRVGLTPGAGDVSRTVVLEAG